MIGIRKTGDWAAAINGVGRAAKTFRRRAEKAVHQEAQHLRMLTVQGLTRQAPGGASIRPLAKLTLATRQLRGFGGTKALIHRGDLRNSLRAVLREDSAWVGVLRQAKAKEGRSLVDVAKVQEFGLAPVVVKLTPRMRWYLMALLRAAGVRRKPRALRPGPGYIIVTIPPRPFLRPAWEQFQRGLKERFAKRLGGIQGDAI
ncbi:MAG TPA: hypothetical protein VFH51_15060 [Myxococcota bacterium]|nr:hypothetical protein [Myxococcota bacterium]